jgi:hypothetical protein
MRRLVVLLFVIVAAVGNSGCSTAAPTPSPTLAPTLAATPTAAPTLSPTLAPTLAPTPTAAPTLSFVPKPGYWNVAIAVNEGNSSFTALITLNVDATGANLSPNVLVGNEVSIGTAKPIVDGSFEWAQNRST